MKNQNKNEKINAINEIKKPSLISIFLLFFKIGSIGFGGGPALISIIQQEIVEKKKWISEKTFLQGLAISLMPPGSIMVNIAFFAGALLRGFSGGVVALFGILIPSFLLMIILAALMVSLKSLNLQNNAIKGLAPAVAGVLLAMIIKMSIEHLKKWWGIIMMVGSTLLMFYFRIPPYVLITIAFLMGGILWQFNGKKSAPEKCPKPEIEIDH